MKGFCEKEMVEISGEIGGEVIDATLTISLNLLMDLIRTLMDRITLTRNEKKNVLLVITSYPKAFMETILESIKDFLTDIINDTPPLFLKDFQAAISARTDLTFKESTIINLILHELSHPK